MSTDPFFSSVLLHTSVLERTAPFSPTLWLCLSPRCLERELPWPCLLVLSNCENMALAVQDVVSKILRASSHGEQHKAAAGWGENSFMAKIGINFREAAD